MTQYEKITTWMIRNPGKEWWYAPDFQKPNMPPDLFVGYEATARMSELVKRFPHWFESKKDGKYRYIRFKKENLLRSSSFPPTEVDDVIFEESRRMDGRLL